jgi:Ca2+-binding RTX toxin-like protein
MVRWLTHLLRRPYPNAAPRAARAARPQLERLDDRLLPSVSASLSNGYLFLNGSNGNDNIVVRQQGGQITVDGLRGAVNVAGLRGIQVNTYQGNDYVYMATVTVPTWIYAGNGNDTIVGGRGNNYIQAGNGRDYIYAGSGGYNTVIVGRAGDAVYNASVLQINVDQNYNQTNNTWCGPVSVSRLMRSYGYNVTPQQVHDAAIDSVDSWVIDQLGLGTKPGSLQSAMRRLGLNAGYEDQIDLNRVLQILGSGKPVVALVRSGSQLHYITLTGYDSGHRLFYYTDTNGGRYQWTYDGFYSAWEWSFGLADAALRLVGVRSRTILY